MKRTLAIAALALAMLVSSGIALSAERDTRGPECANLGAAFGFYSTDPTSGHAIFTIQVTTHAPSCQSVNYVLHEFNGRFTDQVQSGNDTTAITYVVDLGQSPNATPAGTAPTQICVYFTSEIRKHVADRSPDDSCVPYDLDPGGGPGGEGFDQ